MKIFIFNYREDERPFFESYCARIGVSYDFTEEAPSIANIGTLSGYQAVSVVTTPIDQTLIDAFYNVGIRFISTRTMGMDHIDVNYARKKGIEVGNVAYESNIVAEYAVMLMLMASRNVQTIMKRFDGQDFSLVGVRGKTLSNLTVGVIGTGKIGQKVISLLAPFGCQILAYDVYENDAVKQHATYKTLNGVLAESDLITMHLPSTPESIHMINRESIAEMKTGAVIVNTARGTLIDTMALIEGLETKKLGGAALDVLEEEAYLFYKDLKSEPIDHRALNILRSMPNVILTPHTAFYTREAVQQMAENSIDSCVAFFKNE
ncbi:lactate dehydrogenase [Fusibacter paucivorans]|uniref:Lactate dehydrogenase n=1 Tax=Fusibacter paucivorans TaxID=76009 RepID=A0ABS5PVE7_9FIRM|nr:NAD(P)-dependent oxidoreductase [Fusibacter paucivorans]MBS7528646.1 lactate dehydrogenase [Fusibacter paucivorans]